jgi:hypothetical protein
MAKTEHVVITLVSISVYEAIFIIFTAGSHFGFLGTAHVHQLVPGGPGVTPVERGAHQHPGKSMKRGFIFVKLVGQRVRSSPQL